MSDQCEGCGADLWEYPDRYDWCVDCAPEQHGYAVEPEAVEDV
jgi:hypothetical protein